MYSVVFTTNTSSPNHGQIQIVVNTGYSSSAECRIGVTGPTGVIKAFPASPDFVGNAGTITVNIPQDSAGNYIAGNYTVRIQMSDLDEEDDMVVVEDVQEIFPFCDYRQTLIVETIADCYSKTLVVNDNTAYHEDHTITRATTVVYPVIAGETNVANLVSSVSPVLVSLTRSSGRAWHNVIFPITVTSSGEYEETVGDITFFLEYAMSYSENRLVKCNLDACNIISCVDARIAAILTNACGYGGIGKLPTAQKDELSLINTHLAMYRYWLECKDQDKANYHYDQLKALVGECACAEPTGPQIIPDSNIIYLRGYSNYELWLQAGNEGTLDDFLATLYPIGEWIPVPSDVYADAWTPDIAEPLSYRIIRSHLEFKGRFDVVIGAPGHTSPFILLESFDPCDTDYGAAQIYSILGECVGQLYRNGNDWYVRFGASFNRLQDQMVSGLIPLDGFASAGVITGGFYPSLGEWTAFTNSNLQNGFTVTSGNALSWRTDGRFVYFKGSFAGTTWVTSGSIMIPASYWTARNIQLAPGSAATVVETHSSDQGQMDGSVIVDGSGNVQVWATGLTTGTQSIIVGMLAREDD